MKVHVTHKHLYVGGGALLLALLVVGIAFWARDSPVPDPIMPMSNSVSSGQNTAAVSNGTLEKNPVCPKTTETPPILKPVTLPVVSFITAPKIMYQGGLPASFACATMASSTAADALIGEALHHLLTGSEESSFIEFYQAARLAPESIVAHWGLCMALDEPQGEHEAIAQVAIKRLSALAEQVDVSPQEKILADSYEVLSVGGAPSAGKILLPAVAKWRQNLPLRLITAILLHGKYNADTSLSRDGQEAQKLIDEALELNSENHALLYTRAFLEEMAPQPSQEAWEAVQKAATIAPEHAPTQHLWGHLAFLRGDYAEAEKLFTQASDLYDKGRNPLNTTLATDAAWLKAQIYRITSLHRAGQASAAFTQAQQLAALPLDATRPRAAGTLLQQWECATLPARLVLEYDSAPLWKLGRATLPDKADAIEASAPAYEQYAHLLYTYLTLRQDIANKTKDQNSSWSNWNKAKAQYRASREQAKQVGAQSYWMRGNQLLGYLEAQLLPLAQTENVVSQTAPYVLEPASLLMPPVVIGQGVKSDVVQGLVPAALPTLTLLGKAPKTSVSSSTKASKKASSSKASRKGKAKKPSKSSKSSKKSSRTKRH